MPPCRPKSQISHTEGKDTVRIKTSWGVGEAQKQIQRCELTGEDLRAKLQQMDLYEVLRTLERASRGR